MEPPTVISTASVLVVPFIVRFWRWTKRRGDSQDSAVLAAGESSTGDVDVLSNLKR